MAASLWLAVLPDPTGFTRLFNDAYMAVADNQAPRRNVSSNGLRRNPTAKVVDVDDALNEAAQQDLVN